MTDYVQTDLSLGQSDGRIDMDPAAHPVPDHVSPINGTFSDAHPMQNGYENANGNNNGYADGGEGALGEASKTMSNVVRKKLGGYVGFANLPNQVHRRSVR